MTSIPATESSINFCHLSSLIRLEKVMKRYFFRLSATQSVLSLKGSQKENPHSRKNVPNWVIFTNISEERIDIYQKVVVSIKGVLVIKVCNCSLTENKIVLVKMSY